MILKRNIGGMDRAIRIVLSLLMTYFGFSVTDDVAGILFKLIGLGSLLIALIGICPLYYIVKINTHDTTKK